MKNKMIKREEGLKNTKNMQLERRIRDRLKY